MTGIRHMKVLISANQHDRKLDAFDRKLSGTVSNRANFEKFGGKINVYSNHQTMLQRIPHHAAAQWHMSE